MDFLPAKKDGEKKRKAPEKTKTPPKPKLSETSFRDLLQTTKLRFENGFKLFPQLEAEIEKKKNSLTAELIQLDIAQKDKPQEQQQKQCSVWTFMQDRLKQKKNEHDEDYKDRAKSINDFYKEFILSFIFDSEGSGRICQWIKKNGILNLLLLESVGGGLKDDGMPSNDLQQDRWEGLLQLALGKNILQCIYCEEDMKETIAKICTLADKDPDNENKKASYFRRLYADISKSLFFGEKKESKKETSNGHAKKKAKKSHSDDEDRTTSSSEENFEDDDEEEEDEADSDEDDESNDSDEEEKNHIENTEKEESDTKQPATVDAQPAVVDVQPTVDAQPKVDAQPTEVVVAEQ